MWPYETGEVIVQNYNTLLTLATLLDAADGIMLVENEALHSAAIRQMQIARRDAACASWRYTQARLLTCVCFLGVQAGPRWTT